MTSWWISCHRTIIVVFWSRRRAGLERIWTSGFDGLGGLDKVRVCLNFERTLGCEYRFWVPLVCFQSRRLRYMRSRNLSFCKAYTKDLGRLLALNQQSLRALLVRQCYSAWRQFFCYPQGSILSSNPSTFRVIHLSRTRWLHFSESTRIRGSTWVYFDIEVPFLDIWSCRLLFAIAIA